MAAGVIWMSFTGVSTIESFRESWNDWMLR